MGELNFTKMVGAGNDFVLVDMRFKVQPHTTRVRGMGSRFKGELVKKVCDRKNGIGADGMLVLEKSKIADFKMNIFNADGSIAEMCGNGLRCAVLFAGIENKVNPVRENCGLKSAVFSNEVKVETKAGIYEGEITGKDRVKVRMQEPKDLRFSFPINVDGRTIKVNYINTGVPHALVFVEGLDKIDVDTIGSSIRYHDEFKPKGSNVDFVEIIDKENIKMRTYERGVEGETLACGTGAVASAIITSYGLRVTPRLRSGQASYGINVHTRGGILKVEFNKTGNKFKDVYLEGGAKKVFEGQMRT